MEKRLFENLGIETSLLGFGCMRFPLTKEGKIDEAKAEKMLDEAMSRGVNYYDTAYPYHNGDSEPFLGRILDKYDRKSYYLATKLPCWKVDTLEDAKKVFEEQLERLNKDYIDFYLLHALNKERWNKMLKLGIVDFCEDLKRQGKIKYLGFSFHDYYEVFEEILTYRKWDFCQIQYNYMDTDIQAGDRGYELTVREGVPLIIMEPIKGGTLASLPEDAVKFFSEVSPEKSIASWALRWVGTHNNVKVILSGMSEPEQVKDNLDTFEHFEELNEAEKQAVDNVTKLLKSRVKNGCTGCSYCMPCPAGVSIPEIFSIWNNYSVYGRKEILKRWEKMPEDKRSASCIKCGKCEKVCPQGIAIREDIQRAATELDKACGELS